MVKKLFRALFPTKNMRELRRFARRVAEINALEERLQALDDALLRAETPRLKDRLAAGESLEAILPEAFAATREAARRALGLRHFDVQLMGGMALHEERISEMRTGEGKPRRHLPVYLNALAGRGVHVVTVNDYLAQRDAAWMAPVYQALGLSVGVVRSGQEGAEKRAAYLADITYGTNNEFGFDYLRDNMAFTAEDKVQRDRFFAIIDEVDSILIDEARTPLIISGPAEDSSALYREIDQLVRPTPRATGLGRSRKRRSRGLRHRREESSDRASRRRARSLRRP